MEVGAIAFLRVTGIENVAVSPASARLVVAHGGENVVVDRTGYVERFRFALGDFECQISGETGDGNQGIGLQVPLTFCAGKRSRDDSSGGSQQRQTLVTNHLVFHIEV